MPRFIPLLCVVLSSATCALGDYIVSSSEQMNLWLDQGSGPLLHLSLGYQTEPGGLDDPLTVIGDEWWFNSTGVYDLTVDTHIATFLDWATNGQEDQLYMRFGDQYGVELLIGFWEGIWLGHYPDLAPLEITAAQLCVEQVDSKPNGILAIVHMEFLGVPEPGSLILLAAGLLLTRHPRRPAAKQGR